MKFYILLFSIFSFLAFAGNGVERGSVMIQGASGISPEIKSYMGKILTKCSVYSENEQFEVEEVSTRNEKIDQGIVDVFYKIKMKHITKERVLVNNITIEILDSDFHNWRNYEEKLSFELLNDQNKKCF